MGGHADRRSVHHGAVVHYDNVGVRQVFKLYLYTAIAPVPLSSFCRRAEPECGQELYQELLCRVP